MDKLDSHFSKKLRDLEVTPSERANQLFLSKLAAQEPAKKPVWKYFASAASVVLVLGLLWMLHLNTNDTVASLPTETEIEQAIKVISTEEERVAVAKTPEKIDEVTLDKPETTQYETAKPIHKVTEKIVAYQEVVEIKTTEENQRTKLEQLDKLNISYKYQRSNLTDYSIIDVHTAGIEVTPETVIPMSLPKEEEKGEKTLLAKMVDEAKYVLNGEKPDFDRAGIKPAASTIAYNENSFIAHESRQIKDGFNKIKQIFK